MHSHQGAGLVPQQGCTLPPGVRAAAMEQMGSQRWGAGQDDARGEEEEDGAAQLQRHACQRPSPCRRRESEGGRKRREWRGEKKPLERSRVFICWRICRGGWLLSRPYK